MIRNCMKEVANMFGLELGDKFNHTEQEVSYL